MFILLFIFTCLCSGLIGYSLARMRQIRKGIAFLQGLGERITDGEFKGDEGDREWKGIMETIEALR